MATTSMTRPTVGVIGLGIMGGTMAEELLKAGYTVCGFDVDAKAQKRLKKAGGQALANAAEVARQAQILIVSLSTSKALS